MAGVLRVVEKKGLSGLAFEKGVTRKKAEGFQQSGETGIRFSFFWLASLKNVERFEGHRTHRCFLVPKEKKTSDDSV
jgi:hypothetical protein